MLKLPNAASGHFTKADEEGALKLFAQAGKVLEATSLYAGLLTGGALGGERPHLAFHLKQIVGEDEIGRPVLLHLAASRDAAAPLRRVQGDAV